MPRSQRVEDRRPNLSEVKGQPVRAQLRPSSPVRPAERRDLASRQAFVRRVCSEFLEMPGLILSLGQAARLFSLQPSVCARVFDELVEDELLRVTADGRYALARRIT